MMPGVRWGSFRWRKRHAHRSQIIPLADSAKPIWRRRFPLSFAPSNYHCHAVNPLAMATGVVTAAASKLEYAAFNIVGLLVQIARRSNATLMMNNAIGK